MSCRRKAVISFMFMLFIGVLSAHLVRGDVEKFWDDNLGEVTIQSDECGFICRLGLEPFEILIQSGDHFVGENVEITLTQICYDIPDFSSVQVPITVSINGPTGNSMINTVGVMQKGVTYINSVNFVPLEKGVYVVGHYWDCGGGEDYTDSDKSFIAIEDLVVGCSETYEACTPDTGFFSCYQVENVCGSAISRVKLQKSVIKGNQKSDTLWVGPVTIDYKVSGSNSYFSENVGDFDNYLDSSCNNNGCSGQSIPLTGTITLADTDINTQAPTTYNKCPAFYAWDKDISGSDTSWTSAIIGWSGSGGCLLINSVECTEDLDCDVNQRCEAVSCVDIDSCPSTVDYDPSKVPGESPNSQFTDCALWQFFAEYQHCSTTGWYNYNPDSPQTSNLVMTPQQYEEVAPVECLSQPDPDIMVFRFSDNECTQIVIKESERTVNDYDTLEECSTNIIEPPLEIDVFRLEENQCNLITINSDDRTVNDYDTLEECSTNIIEPPNPLIIWLVVGGMAVFLVIVTFMSVGRRRK